MHVEIRVHSPGASERTFAVDASQPITIGRNTDVHVRLDSQRVSRVHARVSVGPTSMRVEDLSVNGTFAGTQCLRRETAEVPLDTPLALGEFTVRFAPLGAPPRQTLSRSHALVLSSPGAQPSPLAATPPSCPSAPPLAAARWAPAPPAPPPAPPTAAPPRAPAPPTLGDLELRREAHRLLLENLDLAAIEPSKAEDPSLRPKVLAALRRVIKSLDGRVPEDVDRDVLIGALADEVLGLGPLERFLADPTVSEIMVVDPETIYVEQRGKIVKTDARFTDDERVRSVIERIITPLGRRIDESSPLVDARLRDGSRVNAAIAPLALRGSCITIRKFSRTPLTLDKLIGFGALSPQMATFLTRAVVAKKNIVIAGGTGSGKTTLLNVLSGAIPEDERVVTIEDAAELQLVQPHVVQLETRPSNMEGRGEVSIRDLVKNALRMRPDRIVVGECRGGEALDMLQAMNTGHDGSLTTTHANSPREALARLETLVLMGGIDLPLRAIREQIAGAVDVLVQQTRLSDGSRKVTNISEVTGIGDDGEIEVAPLFEFVRTGTKEGGAVAGEFRSTGFLPTFLHDFIVMGLIKPGEAFL